MTPDIDPAATGSSLPTLVSPRLTLRGVVTRRRAVVPAPATGRSVEADDAAA